jgi:hypothetical protein
MAQQPGTALVDVEVHLRDAVDQLKLTVDAMHGCEGDVASALGSVRYRLGPRLQAAGIDLHWDVRALPTMTGWSVRESHQMQMLLFEAFANMMRTRARARRACVRGCCLRWKPRDRRPRSRPTPKPSKPSRSNFATTAAASTRRPGSPARAW